MKFLALFLLIFSSSVWAFGNPHLVRSPKGLLMGDSFTAVNDDDFSLFYNPASLGRHKSDLTLYPINPFFSGTDILDDRERFKNFPKNDPVAVSKILMNYPAHVSAGIAPGLKLFNVGVNFIASESFDVLLRNPSHPMMDFDVRSDKGVILGIGMPLGNSRISRKSNSGSQTTLGLSGKYLERTGIKDTFGLASPTVLESLTQKEISQILSGLGRVKGIGWGFDAGLEHVEKSGNNRFILGLAALDIGNTTFAEADHPDKIQVADVENRVNAGIAAGQDFKFFNYVFSAEVRNLSKEMDFRKRLAFGVKLGFPSVTLMGGINSGYYSYGAMIDLGFARVSAGFYDLELGSKYKQIQGERFIIYVSLFDFSFDA